MPIALVIALCPLVIVLFAGFLWVNSMIVFNTPRYMAVAPSMLWRDTHYLRKLPNVLKRLYDAGFQSPWPARPTALSALFFRRKLLRVLKRDFRDARRLIQQHLSMWAFVRLHADDLQREVLNRQICRARVILNGSLDADVRSHVLAFLEQCKKTQTQHAQQPPPPASTMDGVGWLARLRSFDVLLREHGYRVADEFAVLDRWEDADNETILREVYFGPGVSSGGIATLETNV